MCIMLATLMGSGTGSLWGLLGSLHTASQDCSPKRQKGERYALVLIPH